MAPKTKKHLLLDMLEDLSKSNFDRFCHQLLDRREEPRVRRNRVEGKSALVIADVLVSTFTEDGAVPVAVEILTQIDCSEEAKKLDDDVKEAAGASVRPGSSDRLSLGTSGKNTRTENCCTAKHFVDQHKLELIKRVSNIASILDELLDHNVIKEEVYDKIRALPTTQEKMRELYAGPLRASEECKDVFYEILERNESYLIKDLKK